MPTTNDFYQKLTDVDDKLAVIETKLDTLHGDLTGVRTAVTQVNATLLSGFNKLITLGQYANLALAQNAAQNDTIICALEHIARNTCEALNQAALQTALQGGIREDADALADMYATAHADAAITRERLRALKAQMEECCPPPTPEPPCDYSPCPAPRPLRDPPSVSLIDAGKGAAAEPATPAPRAKG